MLCTKCGVSDASGDQRWCKSCRATYQREYRDQEIARIGARNWMAGANAIRQAMAAQLERAPASLFQAAAVAQWIREFPQPACPPPPTKPTKPETD